jgi:hypothetical protein
VRPGRVVVRQVLGQHPAQVLLVDDQQAVEEFPAQVPMIRSQIASLGELAAGWPVGFQNSATSPDLGFLCGSLIFVDEAAEDGPTLDSLVGEVGGGGGRAGAGGAGGCDGVCRAKNSFTGADLVFFVR